MPHYPSAEERMHTAQTKSEPTRAGLQEWVVLHQALAAVLRECAWLRQELTTARVREQDYRAQLAWFRQYARAAQPPSDLAPDRQPETRARSTPLPVSMPALSPTAARRRRREQIVTWLHAHPGPQACKAIEHGVGCANLRHTLRHMVNAGLLTRVAPGIFHVREAST